MSSSGGGTGQTFWCHPCDMSVTIFQGQPLRCPNCLGDCTESMESPDSFAGLTPASVVRPPSSDSDFPSDGEDVEEASELGEHLLGAGDRLLEAGDRLLGAGDPIHWRMMPHLYYNLAAPRPFGAFPASKDSVEAIPTIKITEDTLAVDSVICAVCKDEFGVDADAKQLPCRHVYHGDCILPWLKGNNSCPVCRYCFPKGDAGSSGRNRFDGLMRLHSRRFLSLRGRIPANGDDLGVNDRFVDEEYESSLAMPYDVGRVTDRLAVLSTVETDEAATSPTQIVMTSSGPANIGETVSGGNDNGDSLVARDGEA